MWPSSRGTAHAAFWSMHIRTFCVLGAVALNACTTSSTKTETAADKKSHSENVIDEATATISRMKKDTALGEQLANAHGVFIFPKVVKAALGLGGSGGTGVLLAHDKQHGWSAPAFYKIGGGSAGLQLGYSETSFVFVLKNDKALSSAISTGFTLGVDATAAMGSHGSGAQATTADVITFAEVEGAFAGVSADGAVLKPSGDMNEEMYGAGVSTKAITLDHKFDSDPRVQDIRAAVLHTPTKPVGVTRGILRGSPP